ncbi:hypothetical protein PMZ80_004199 [Knufia obscura]|uniref:Uncharacterized protein n=1 Tax=Knufia obscura TaxID=1635080 RepID=A0ABR0RSG3_9EURO|nr:hypothetical protein PMZ80_004199 [Knufia obscura]
MQDELSDMMARNMHLGVQAPTADMSNPPTPEVVPQPAPITYISQHYHHSAHVVPTTTTDDIPVSTILRHAGVNADALLPSQLQLFKNAQRDQQERLVELWRIAPPTYGNQLVSGNMGDWPQTNLEMEETAARERYEKQEQQRLKNLSVLPSQDTRALAEPYMTNRYDEEMSMDNDAPIHRQATDPAYNREREWWHMAAGGPMEHQYGMVQQAQMMRGFCGVVDGDRMW